MDSSCIPAILVAPLHLLDGLAGSIIGDKLPYDYLATLAEEDRTYALQACLIVFIVTRFTIVPRVFQPSFRSYFNRTRTGLDFHHHFTIKVSSSDSGKNCR
jgi:hypothetical protein